MNRGHKKQGSRYKFDTSTKNLACFIRRRSCRKSGPKHEFRQQVFLEDILNKVLQEDFAPSQVKALIETSRKETCYTKESDEEITLNEEDNYKLIIRSCSKGLPQFQSQVYPHSYCLPLRCKREETIEKSMNALKQVETDGRTTLMIRHIPNKYTEDMLLEEINKNHRNKYNFLYLPIDHNNSCNVGYAFVNFIHTKFIFDFYQEFNGKKWIKFNSEKICELAYARIQGTTNLIQHFEHPAGPYPLIRGMPYHFQRKISSEDNKAKSCQFTQDK